MRNLILTLAVLFPGSAILALILMTTGKPALAWMDRHPGLAGWVQAFGAIASIAALAVVAAVESRRAAIARDHERELGREAALRAEEREKAVTDALRESIVHATKFAAERAGKIIDKLEEDPDNLSMVRDVYYSDLSITEGILSALPIHQAADAAAMGTIGKCRISLNDFKSVLDNLVKIFDRSKKNDEMKELIPSYVDILKKQRRNIDHFADTLAKRWNIS